MNILALAFASVLAAQTPPPSPPKSEVETLRAELEKKNAHIQDLQRQLDSTNTWLHKLEQSKLEQKKTADSEALRAYEKSVEYITKIQALEAEAKARALSELAAKGTPKAVAPAPTPPPPVVRQYTYQGKITAVANEIGLVVISLGKADGVGEGHVFSILREGTEMGTLTIDRVDQKWATGKLSPKSEARVGDDILLKKAATVQHQLYGTVFSRDTQAPVVVTRSSADELRALRKELDEVRSQVRQLSDKIVPSYQGAGVSVDEAPEELRAHLGLLRGLLVRQVREGSPAERAGLKVNDVVPDLLEAQLLEAIQSGMSLYVVRKGQRVQLAAIKER